MVWSLDENQGPSPIRGQWPLARVWSGPRKSHCTLGVEAKGRGKPCDLVDWELKANLKSLEVLYTGMNVSPLALSWSRCPVMQYRALCLLESTPTINWIFRSTGCWPWDGPQGKETLIVSAGLVFKTNSRMDTSSFFNTFISVTWFIPSDSSTSCSQSCQQ
jgi:hypothetical protein